MKRFTEAFGRKFPRLALFLDIVGLLSALFFVWWLVAAHPIFHR